jgi:hypothetical protein
LTVLDSVHVKRAQLPDIAQQKDYQYQDKFAILDMSALVHQFMRNPLIITWEDFAMQDPIV